VTVLVDTSILIDELRGNQLVHAELGQALRAEERLTASALSKVEILGGMRTGEEEATYGLLSLLEWIPVDDGMAQRAGELARRYLRTHPGIDPVDFVIAIAVDDLDAELWTRNRKHFPMVERIRDVSQP
jgi:predicted nucleic acid-binding protein